MNVKTLFIFIHGMAPDQKTDHSTSLYQAFRVALCDRKPELNDVFVPENCIYVEYGHPARTVQPLRDDQKLNRAEAILKKRISYDYLRHNRDPHNLVQHDLSLVAALFRSSLLIPLREKLLLHSLGDAIYYSSPDGESAIRRTVYGQILNRLEPFLNEEVRLHFITHGLGSVIAHDFLFGLFAPSARWAKGQPDFLADDDYGPIYLKWRAKAQGTAPMLTLRSIVTMASQLPLFLLRRQTVLDHYYNDQKLDPRDIGIPLDGPVRWKIFYDVDDILAFATRNIYITSTAIQDIQVRTGSTPEEAHFNYFTNRRVMDETGVLIASTL
jgi:hypothetical protein